MYLECWYAIILSCSIFCSAANLASVCFFVSTVSLAVLAVPSGSTTMFGGAGNFSLGTPNFFMGSYLADCGSSSDSRVGYAFMHAIFSCA